MHFPTGRAARHPYLWLALALFLAGGAALLPVLGVQNDEAVSVGAFHPPPSALGAVNTPIGKLPLMQVSYAGTLKSWLYRGVFAVVAPSKLSIRAPALLLGALTLWLFYLWTRRAASTTVAGIGVLLLATDPSFLITTCFDWGPVALQHLLFGAGVFGFVHFAADGEDRWLVWACAAFGLGLWDKALFVWMLSGAAVATALVYRREAVALFSARRLTLGLAAFCLAASPLLLYNLAQQGTTAGAFEPQLGVEHLLYRLGLMGDTLDGSALSRYMLSEPAAADWLPQTPLPILFVIALALTPWLGTSRADRLRQWAAVAFLVAYPQTLIGKDVGVGSHHVVLLWPLPHLIVAGWLASLGARQAVPDRRAAAVAALCVAANLIAVGSFVQRAYRGGSAVIWTTAIHPLHNELKRLSPQRISVLDWGVYDALRVLGEGELPIHNAMDSFVSDNAAHPSAADPMQPSSGVVFVDHVAERRILAGVRQRFDARMHSAGLRAVPIAAVRDRKGRTVFEVFGLERAR